MGFILAVSGAFILSYNKGKSLTEVFMDGTGYVILSSLVLSVAFILSKSLLKMLTRVSSQ
jgi:hypothetical protein